MNVRAVTFVSEAGGGWNRRFGVALADDARVEAVVYRNDTLCVSCQVGCAVRCPFCASGAQGLARNLTFEEMIGQVTAARERGIALRRVTVSGVGEPLHNPAALTPFFRWCHHERLPVSWTTSGGPLARLRELMALEHRGVTVSVHAGTESVRAKLVPHGPALSPLFSTLADALQTVSRSRRRKVALAYLLLAGENDGADELDAFAAQAVALALPVHLYAYNLVATSSARPVPRARYDEAYQRLRSAGLVVRMSSQARMEANGGCGTLIALGQRPAGRVR